jgi:lipid-binding SYLF domain-containing protein
MKSIGKGLLGAACLALAVVTAAGTCSAATETRLNKRVRTARYVFEEMEQMPDTAIPEGLIKNCSGIAIFPNMIKGAFVIGGKYGQGVMIARKEDGSWSAPMFLSIGGGSFGFQIGGQATDVILVIMSKRGVDSFAHSNVTLGGEASVAAGPVGRKAQLETDVLMTSGVFSYSRSKGLFAGVSLEGAVVGPMKNLNEDYYGEDVTADDILTGDVEPTDEGSKLISAVKEY